eukprot:GHVU01097193.1.p3 GENE.GHVU01097193.1~~GHVU01097193.1.p3  ORF type:complete len:108 (+),score=10.05 GHVU01097193.1:522-845(+)
MLSCSSCEQMNEIVFRFGCTAAVCPMCRRGRDGGSGCGSDINSLLFSSPITYADYGGPSVGWLPVGRWWSFAAGREVVVVCCRYGLTRDGHSRHPPGEDVKKWVGTR